MKTILKILNSFFVVLGVLFLIQILVIWYVVVADPFNFKPLINATGFSPTTAIKSAISNNEPEEVTDENPLLSSDQEKQLQAIGVDPAVLPTEITPAMQECFVKTLGQERVNIIVQTGSPTPADFFAARECL